MIYAPFPSGHLFSSCTVDGTRHRLLGDDTDAVLLSAFSRQERTEESCERMPNFIYKHDVFSMTRNASQLQRILKLKSSIKTHLLETCVQLGALL